MEDIETAADDGAPELLYRHEVQLVKQSKRALNIDKIGEQLALLMARIETPGRVDKGWSATWDGTYRDVPESVPGTAVRARGNTAQIHNYTVTLAINCSPKRPRAGIPAEFQNIVGILQASSNRGKWSVAQVDGQEAKVSASEFGGVRSSSDDYVGYAPFVLPADARQRFGHVYGRDSQIHVMMSAVEAALDSDWTNRYHVVLMGPPACGKTELLLTVKRMVGSDSCLVFDGTSTTQAGAQKEFMEREELPRILIIEEIEKTDESALRYLLGLLDDRGEIRKMTAREKIVRDARVLCLATVNDIDKFGGMLSGALASRFRHKIYCPRPDRDLMRKILAREVGKVDRDGKIGGATWIEPTLDYMQEISASDPRQAIAICLSGREGWLDGSYPTMLREIRKVGDVLTGTGAN